MACHSNSPLFLFTRFLSLINKKTYYVLPYIIVSVFGSCHFRLYIQEFFNAIQLSKGVP